MTLKPSADELKTILEQHSKWRHEEDAGQRANLRDADLRGAKLQRADLQDANLQDADVWGAELRDADLRGTILERTPTSPADDASDEAQIRAEYEARCTAAGREHDDGNETAGTGRRPGS